jgi:muramoyltetrapeptide carboxypeptidase
MRIGVVAPSGAFDRKRLEQSMRCVREWGIELVEGPHLSARHRYTAGTAVERGADLAWALTAPDLDAAWFARGGFGTVHLLHDLPWTEMDGRPVLGFSDATALFCAMAHHGIRGGVHGPVLYSLADHVDDETRAAVRVALTGQGQLLTLAAEQVAGPVRAVEGPVVGGNLCMLGSLAGTPWALQSKGAILVLEDVAEAPYRIDRLITQLRHSGGLDGVAGIVLGSFTGCDAPDGADWTLRDVLMDLLAPLDVPVWSGLPVGHGAQNRPWYHGGQGRLADGGLSVARD